MPASRAPTSGPGPPMSRRVNLLVLSRWRPDGPARAGPDGGARAGCGGSECSKREGGLRRGAGCGHGAGAHGDEVWAAGRPRPGRAGQGGASRLRQEWVLKAGGRVATRGGGCGVTPGCGCGGSADLTRTASTYGRRTTSRTWRAMTGRCDARAQDKSQAPSSEAGSIEPAIGPGRRSLASFYGPAPLAATAPVA